MTTDAEWSNLDAEWLAQSRTNDLERAWYRMPIGFGRAPGPRNIPVGEAGGRGAGYLANSRAETISVAALTDEAKLKALLPPGIELRGDDPTFWIFVLMNHRIYFHAGYTYLAMVVNIPVTSYRDKEPVDGLYIPVEWHNRPDNMLTAREEIAYPALWANIDLTPRGSHSATAFASWNGFRFFDMRVDELEDTAPPPPEYANLVDINYKYVPRGYEDGKEFSRVVVNDKHKYWASGGASDPTVQEDLPDLHPEQPIYRTGIGSFEWHRAEWQDMPTQFHVTQVLADLPLLEFQSARYSSTPGVIASRRRS